MSLLHRRAIKKAASPYYNFTAPAGSTLFGRVEYTNSLTETFEVSPSHTGGSITTSNLGGLSYGSWNSSKIPPTWVDFGSKYWWWNGNAGSWTQSGSMSFGCFIVRTASVIADAAIISNWVNNIERWHSGFIGSSTSIGVYGTGGGAMTTLTLNQVYWLNVTYNSSTVSMYLDNTLVSQQSSRGGSASGYLSLANYYAIGNYVPGTGRVYVNNLRIFRDSSTVFLPS